MKARQRKTKIVRRKGALTWSLWPETSYALLEILREDIQLHLEWVAHDLVQVDPGKVPKEMQRVADRLKAIEELVPAASIVIQLPAHDAALSSRSSPPLS
jgi:hypothetical protein